MYDPIQPLLVTSIVFLVLFIIILAFNCYTYSELYKKAVDSKTKTWGMALLACNVIGIILIMIAIGTCSLALLYYEPNTQYKSYISNTNIISKQ